MIAWALRSVMPRPAATSRSRTPGSRAMQSRTRAWLVRRFQRCTLRNLSHNSRNILHVSGFLRSLGSAPAEPAAAGRDQPGHLGSTARIITGAPVKETLP
jgi:hypothetical protein